MDYSKIARELGKQGGKKTLQKYGKDHFIRISQLGAEARRKKLIQKDLVDSHSTA